VFVQVSPSKAEFGLQNTSSRTCWRKLTGWFGDLTGKFVRLAEDRVRGVFISFLGELNIPGVHTGFSWDGVNFLLSSPYCAMVWLFKVTFRPLPLLHPLSQKQRITELYVRADLPP